MLPGLRIYKSKMKVAFNSNHQLMIKKMVGFYRYCILVKPNVDDSLDNIFGMDLLPDT